LEGNICYELWLFLSPTSHFILSFLFSKKKKISSFFFDLKGERERISYAAKTEKATHFNLRLSKGEKEEKCMICFLPVFPPPPSISLTLSD
jgi:hypothetical protein